MNSPQNTTSPTVDLINQIQESDHSKYTFLRVLDPKDSVGFCAQMIRTMTDEEQSTMLETDTIPFRLFVNTLRTLGAAGQLHRTYCLYTRIANGDVNTNGNTPNVTAISYDRADHWIRALYSISGDITRKPQPVATPSVLGWMIQTFLVSKRVPQVVHVVLEFADGLNPTVTRATMRRTTFTDRVHHESSGNRLVFTNLSGINTTRFN